MRPGSLLYRHEGTREWQGWWLQLKWIRKYRCRNTCGTSSSRVERVWLWRPPWLLNAQRGCTYGGDIIGGFRRYGVIGWGDIVMMMEHRHQLNVVNKSGFVATDRSRRVHGNCARIHSRAMDRLVIVILKITTKKGITMLTYLLFIFTWPIQIVVPTVPSQHNGCTVLREEKW